MFWALFQVVRLLIAVAAFIPVAYLGLAFVYAAIRSASVQSIYYLFFATLFLGLACDFQRRENSAPVTG